MDSKNKVKLNFYGNIITKIAIFLILFFWYQVDHRLTALEARLRTVELQITAISARLGIDTQARLKGTGKGTVKELRAAGGNIP